MVDGNTLVVGQSGGPTAVINESLAGVIGAAMSAGGEVGDILGLAHGVEGLLEGNFRNLRRQAPDFLRSLRETPSSILGSCRYRLRDADFEPALTALRVVGARYFVYIGGNDSADTTHRLALAARAANYDLRCVGVPKTVDNDLVGMDHCPGYGSAARYVAISTMEACRDTEAMRRSDPVKLIEVAGRHAGWIAAASALGRRAPEEGPHLVYLPERPVDAEQVVHDVAGAHREFGHVVVVLSENQPESNGAVLGSGGLPHHVDPFGHTYFQSPAQFLARALGQQLGLRARWEKPGTMQRTSTAHRSQVDADEALELGREAVRMALAGMSDCMAIIQRESDHPYRSSLGIAPLSAIANAQRVLPAEFISEPSSGLTHAYRQYAEPLLGGPLPNHARLT